MDNVRIYFPMNGKDRCFGSTDEKDYKLVLRLLLDCGYKIKADIKSPTNYPSVTRTIYLEVQGETEKECDNA